MENFNHYNIFGYWFERHLSHKFTNTNWSDLFSFNIFSINCVCSHTTSKLWHSLSKPRMKRGQFFCRLIILLGLVFRLCICCNQLLMSNKFPYSFIHSRIDRGMKWSEVNPKTESDILVTFFAFHCHDKMRPILSINNLCLDNLWNERQRGDSDKYRSIVNRVDLVVSK